MRYKRVLALCLAAALMVAGGVLFAFASVTGVDPAWPTALTPLNVTIGGNGLPPGQSLDVPIPVAAFTGASPTQADFTSAELAKLTLAGGASNVFSATFLPGDTGNAVKMQLTPKTTLSGDVDLSSQQIGISYNGIGTTNLANFTISGKVLAPRAVSIQAAHADSYNITPAAPTYAIDLTGTGVKFNYSAGDTGGYQPFKLVGNPATRGITPSVTAVAMGSVPQSPLLFTAAFDNPSAPTKINVSAANLATLPNGTYQVTVNLSNSTSDPAVSFMGGPVANLTFTTSSSAASLITGEGTPNSGVHTMALNTPYYLYLEPSMLTFNGAAPTTVTRKILDDSGYIFSQRPTLTGTNSGDFSIGYMEEVSSGGRVRIPITPKNRTGSFSGMSLQIAKSGGTSPITVMQNATFQVTENTITGIDSGYRLDANVRKNGNSLTGSERIDRLSVKSSDTIALEINSDYFTWSAGKPSPARAVTTKELTDANIEAELRSGGTNRDVVDSVSISTPNSNRNDIQIKFKSSSSSSSRTGNSNFEVEVGLTKSRTFYNTITLEGTYTSATSGSSGSSSGSSNNQSSASSGSGTTLNNGSSAATPNGTVISPSGATPGLTIPGNTNTNPGTGR